MPPYFSIITIAWSSEWVRRLDGLLGRIGLVTERVGTGSLEVGRGRGRGEAGGLTSVKTVGYRSKFG